MRVQVKLFAMLSRFRPDLTSGTPFEVELPPSATLQDLIDHLKIPPEEAKVAFVNNVSQQPDYRLQEGDIVGIFPPIAGGSHGMIKVDVWLYGDLARFGGETEHSGYANLKVELHEGSMITDLLGHLNLPTEERGITFINGKLSAMPGVQPDMNHILQDGDRVAFFHLRSMWPFQYRFGVPMIEEMSEGLQSREDKGIHHAYE